MTRARKVEVERVEPSLSPQKAVELLKGQIAKIEALTNLDYNDPEVNAWCNFTEQVIIKAFGKPSENLDAYHSARFPGVISPDTDWQEEHVSGLRTTKRLLEGFIEQLEAFAPAVSDVSEGGEGRQATSPTTNEVFIVHGHDHQAKTELALVLTRMGLNPIILHEQPNEGLTIIEKLEKHSIVGYAFIILTPDDVGHPKDAPNAACPRARQNVVFEFGLFVGRLSRSRVCCLCKGEVEIPSDLHGLAYHRFNNSVHELILDIAKELRRAGYNPTLV